MSTYGFLSLAATRVYRGVVTHSPKTPKREFPRRLLVAVEFVKSLRESSEKKNSPSMILNVLLESYFGLVAHFSISEYKTRSTTRVRYITRFFFLA